MTAISKNVYIDNLENIVNTFDITHYNKNQNESC